MKKMLFNFSSLLLLSSSNNLFYAGHKIKEDTNFIQSIANKYEDESVKVSDINFINIYTDIQNSVFNSQFQNKMTFYFDLKELQSKYYSPYFEFDRIFTPDYSRSWVLDKALGMYMQLMRNNIVTIYEYMIVVSIAIDIVHYYSIHNNSNRIEKMTKSVEIIKDELKTLINNSPAIDYTSSLVNKEGNFSHLINDDVFWNKTLTDYQNHIFNPILEKYRNFDYLSSILEDFRFLNSFLISAFAQTINVTPVGPDQNLDSTLAHSIKYPVKSLVSPSQISVFNLSFNMKFNTDFYTYAGWATNKLKFYQPSNFDITIN